jgi:membrane-associated phospholipid phosphatase
MAIPKKLIAVNISLGAMVLLGIFFIDRPLAGFISRNLIHLAPSFNYLTVHLDYITHFILFELFGSLPFFLLFSGVVGLLCLASRKTKPVALFLLTMVFAYPTTAILTNIIKAEVKRARPEVYLQTSGSTRDFYSEQVPNDSFPSGHVALYLSLFLPAALAFRKYAPFFLLIPGIILLGRVIQNQHYLSDVLFSVALALDLCLMAHWLFTALGRALTGLLKKTAH